MAYYLTQQRIPVQAKTPVSGLGAGISFDISNISNQLVNAAWPAVERKVVEFLPRAVDMAVPMVEQRIPQILNTAMPMIQEQVPTMISGAMPMIVQQMPTLIGQAVPAITRQIPTIINAAMPTVEKKADELVAKYQLKYVTPYKKYAGPLALVGIAFAALLGGAALVTLKKAKKQ